MSTPTPISVLVATAPAATGSNALKALKAAGAESGSAPGGAAVAFTLGDAGQSPDEGSMKTLLNNFAKGAAAVSGAAAHAKGKPAAPTGLSAANATDGTLLSMLQAIAIAPTVNTGTPVSPVAVPATNMAAVPSAIPAAVPAAATAKPDLNVGKEGETVAAALGNAAVATITGALTAGPALGGANGALSLLSSVLDAVLPGVAGDLSQAGVRSTGGNSAEQSGPSLASATMLPAQPAAPNILATTIAQADTIDAALTAVIPQSTPVDPAVAKAKIAQPATAKTVAIPSDAIANLIGDVSADLPPNVLQLQRQSLQRTAPNGGGPVAVAQSPGSVTETGSSGLLSALSRTLSDAAAASPALANDGAFPAQAMSATFSSLLQQITDGGAHTHAASAGIMGDSSAADLQLASAVSNAASPALAMPLPVAAADAGASTNAAVVSPSTPAPIDTTRQNWPDALGSRVEWMLHQGLQEARIELHPRDMGSINVHIKLGNDGADVRFAATNPNVRDALESSLPKLRELLAGSGLQLAQAQVGSQMQQQDSAGRFLPQQAPARSPSTASGNTANADVQPQSQLTRVRVARVSIIDDYA